MFELTEEQRQELSAAEPVAIDPSTKETYVLVRKNVYDRMKGLLYDDGEWTEVELRLLLARSAEENGWNEPGMGDYDQYDANRAEQRKQRGRSSLFFSTLCFSLFFPGISLCGRCRTARSRRSAWPRSLPRWILSGFPAWSFE